MSIVIYDNPIFFPLLLVCCVYRTSTDPFYDTILLRPATGDDDDDNNNENDNSISPEVGGDELNVLRFLPSFLPSFY